jgi:hypothetical protein
MNNSHCIHHWLIDKDGKGTCKKCGAMKIFPVYTNVDKFIPAKTLNANAMQARKISALVNITPSI